jgi:hypothetical protein
MGTIRYCPVTKENGLSARMVQHAAGLSRDCLAPISLATTIRTARIQDMSRPQQAAADAGWQAGIRRPHDRRIR